MKSPRNVFVFISGMLIVAGLVVGSACSKSEPPAPAAAVNLAPAAAQSAPAAAIASHLEFGGEFYAVVDVKGELEKYGGTIANVLTGVLQQTLATTPIANPALAKLDIPNLFTRLGFYGVDGLGLSSWQGPDGLHHNRAFLYIPNGRTGLLKIFGGASGPFVTPGLAPADADLTMETTLDLKSVAELILNYARDIGGANATAQIEPNLQQEFVPGISPQILIDHLDTRLIIITRANTQEVMQVTPQFAMPMIDALISLDNFSEIFDKLAPTLHNLPMFKFGEKNGMQTVTLDMPIPAPYSSYQPMLISDPKTKRLYLVSRPSFADETVFGQGARLSSGEDFKAATEGLPTQGNTLSYFSKKAAATFVEYYSKQGLSQLPPSSRASVIAMGGLDKIPHGLANVQVNLPDGILVQGVANQSYKEVVMLGPVVAAGLVSAMAIPAFEKVRTASREKAITNNLRLVANAAHSYMLEKNVPEVSYADLTGGPAPYLHPVAPVNGESYDSLVIRADTTRISVTTSDGQVVSFDL